MEAPAGLARLAAPGTPWRPDSEQQDKHLPTPNPDHGKFAALDALRGFASLIVFVGHFCDGLAPGISVWTAGTPFFAALNGSASVILFFVLSGFVLIIRPIQIRRLAPLGVLLLKRWPRLAGPTTLAGVFLGVAALLGAFPSFKVFAHRLPPHSHHPPYLFWGEWQHNDHIVEVLREAAFGVFINSSADHNVVLWTMHFELLGSVLAAGLAATILLPLPRMVRATLFLGTWIGAAFVSPWLAVFPVGVCGAIAHRAFGGRLRIGGPLAALMAAGGALLFSWDPRTSLGIWAWTAWLDYGARLWAWLALQALAACLFMAVFLYNPTVRAWCSGRLGKLAGRYSFPLYLVHVPVLCSVGAWLYLRHLPDATTVWSNITAFGLDLGAALLVATPLMFFDQWWLRQLHRLDIVVRFRTSKH